MDVNQFLVPRIWFCENFQKVYTMDDATPKSNGLWETFLSIRIIFVHLIFAARVHILFAKFALPSLLRVTCTVEGE